MSSSAPGNSTPPAEGSAIVAGNGSIAAGDGPQGAAPPSGVAMPTGAGVSGNAVLPPAADFGAVLTRKSLLIMVAILVGATLIVAVICSLIGRLNLGWNSQSWDILRFRLVRLAMAAIVGAALASAGMSLQALLRNPLADPYILGISSGAGVGVLVSLIVAPFLPIPDWAITPALALAGSLSTCGAVYALAQRRGRLDPYVLLLSGVIVNVLNGAMILCLLLFSRRDKIVEFIGWSMGQVPEWLWSQPRLIAVCAACVLAGWAAVFLRGASYNAMGLGDDVAATSGVAVHWVRVETFVVVSVMTAASVALAGPIGFLGLVVPHICRMVVGPDHRRLAILGGFVGAMFLMLADTFCRTAGEWFGKGEIPLGIVTALTGGPFFIYLLRRRFREGAI